MLYGLRLQIDLFKHDTNVPEGIAHWKVVSFSSQL